MHSGLDDAEETATAAVSGDYEAPPPDHEAILRDIQIQLRGPGLSGWPQLGIGADGRHRTLVDAVAATLAQIAELRTEVGDLEATVADLQEQVRQLSQPRLPWPLSLIQGTVSLLSEQVAWLESLLPELPGQGGAPQHPSDAP